MQCVKQELKFHFESKDIGVSSMFVGVQFTREGSSASLPLTNYIGEILKIFLITNCRFVAVFMI